MKRVSPLAAVMVGLLLAASSLRAEDKPDRPKRPDGHGPGPGGGMMTFMLLGNDKVQAEIGLNDDQKSQLAKIREDMRGEQGKLEGLRDMSEEDRRAKMKEMREKNDGKMDEVRKQVDDVLTADQKTRLKEISIQARGAMALHDPEVAKQLEITDEQREKLGEIQRETRESMRDRGEGERGKMQETVKAAEDKAMAVLTDEQRSKLTEMGGKKLDVDRRELLKGAGRPDGPPRNRPDGDGKKPPKGDKKPQGDEKPKDEVK